MVVDRGMGAADGPWGEQIGRLRQRVDDVNVPGSLEGLNARHVLGSTVGVTWRVDPELAIWLAEEPNRHLTPGGLAALGYLSPSVHAEGPTVEALLEAGCCAIQRRDVFPSDRLTFLYDFRLLVGVCLAARRVSDRAPQHGEWLLGVLQDRRFVPANRFQEVARRYAMSLLTGDLVALEFTSDLHQTDELAIAAWLVTSGAGSPVGTSDTGAADLARRTVQAAFLADTRTLPQPVVALLLAATTGAAMGAADDLIRGAHSVGSVLRRFPAAMRRWRWDSDDLADPVRWPIRSEREVQDVLWIMLRSCFDDVVDEDPLPKVGHASYRVDFAVPRLRTLIEVKFAYKASDFKKIEKELMQDASAYLRHSRSYDQIVVFIYDDSAAVEQHDLTDQALRGVTGISDVVIVSRPGVLAGRTTSAASGVR